MFDFKILTKIKTFVILSKAAGHREGSIPRLIGKINVSGHELIEISVKQL